MAESTLSLTYAEIQREVARFLGWDRDPTNWAADNSTDFADILKAGLRRAYFPPPAGQGSVPFGWSFLRPTATFNTADTDYDYDLPDDFSGIVEDGSFTFAVGSNKRALKKIDDAELRRLQALDNQTGDPTYYAIRPKAHDPTAGQRWEVLLYPTPDATLTISYTYTIIPDIMSATDLYPHGGVLFNEVVVESILAMAENRIDDEPQGIHEARFMSALQVAIKADSEHQNAPKEAN